MPPQGEVARQWFIPGEGIDRNVISADIQRYLGNDATVRPGVGTGEYHGVQGFWIKAYRNLTSAMIADLRADSKGWRQEQRQQGSGDTYVGSRTFEQSNAARTAFQRGGNNSPNIDYDTQRQGGDRPGRPHDPMQIDAGRGAQNPYGQTYPPQDNRGGQYPTDPNRGYPQPGRGQPYMDQAMVDTYGQPDSYGRLPVNQYPQDRMPQNYRPPPPPVGYTQQGEYYVPSTTGAYQQSGIGATAGGYPQYDSRGQQLPPLPGQQGRGGQSGYPQQDQYNPYPSPAQTVPEISPRNPQQQSYGYPQGQYDNTGRPASGPNYGQQQYADPAYPPPGRESNARAQQPPQPSQQRDTDRRHRRNG